jgi:hypothetical protein
LTPSTSTSVISNMVARVQISLPIFMATGLINGQLVLELLPTLCDPVPLPLLLPPPDIATPAIPGYPQYYSK